MQLFFSGLKFGLLLLIAFFASLRILDIAENTGTFTTLLFILVTAVFSYEISTLMNVIARDFQSKLNVRTLKYFVSFILIFFGLNVILNAFGMNTILGLDLKPMSSSTSKELLFILLRAVLIAFWIGVCINKIVQENLENKKMVAFLSGLLSSALLLSCVAALGIIILSLISVSISNALNASIGLLVIFFGVKLFIRN